YGGKIAAAAGAPTLGALLAHPLQAFLDRLDPRPQQPSVGLQLGFARTAPAYPAFLAFEAGPAARQPRPQMLALRQLHPPLALMGGGALCEYIEDQPGAVENSALELTLQVALLARREAVVEQHQRCVGRPYRGGDLLDLAAADESAGGNRGARPRDESDRF